MEEFFDAEVIFATLGLYNQVNIIAEFDCGYGTFTILAIKVIKGKVYAFDIERWE